MITGIDPKQVVDYVAKQDTGESPTQWGIGVMSMEDKNTVLAGALNPDGSINYQELIKNTLPILKKGLKRVKNYKLNKDVEVKDYDKIDESIVESIPVDIQFELLDKIVEMNFASRQDEKN